MVLIGRWQAPSNFLGGERVLKVIKFIMACVVVVLGIYSLMTNNNFLLPYMMWILGVFIFISGIIELQEGRNTMGYFNFAAAGFILIVSLVY